MQRAGSNRSSQAGRDMCIPDTSWQPPFAVIETMYVFRHWKKYEI